MRNITIKSSILLASVLVIAAVAQEKQAPANKPAIEVLPVRGNIYMLIGAGGNVTASIGSEGVLLVDTGLANNADKLLATVNRLSVDVETKGLPNVNVGPPKAIRIIVNTHLHGGSYRRQRGAGESGPHVYGRQRGRKSRRRRRAGGHLRP